MRHWITCFWILTLASTPVFGQGEDSTIQHTLKNFVAKLPQGAEISVARIKGETVRFYGYRMEEEPVPTENRTAGFEIGSLTKVFTATVFAGMVEDGIVNANDRVDKLLNIRMKDKATFTLEQLTNHTSGLPRVPSNLFFSQSFRMSNPYKSYSELDLLAYLQTDVVLIDKPGKTFEYSNLGMGLLGVVLQRVSGIRYEQLVRQYVTGPLEMNRTTFLRNELGEDLVVGYSKSGDPTEYWDFMALKGAGALLSCTQDLAAFVQAQFSETETAIQETHEATFRESSNLSVGLGWMLVKDRNKTYYFHNGGTGGFSSSMLIDPASESGVVILCSVSPEYFQGATTDDLSKQLMQIE